MAERVTNTTVQYSKYYEQMDRDAKPRYEEKIRMIGLVDPYRHLEGLLTASIVAVSQLLNGTNGPKSCMQTFLTI